MKRPYLLPFLLFSILPKVTWAALPDDITTRANSLKAELVEIRRDLHMHPELSNHEVRTAGVVAQYLVDLNLDQVTTGVAHTGVVGLLKGGRPGPVIALRADMDALPITETNNVPYKSKRPGVKHACGHDAHTTILMGTAKLLSEMRETLPGTVKFIFQPAEEGPPPGQKGGASYMIEQGVLTNPKPEAILGLHVRPHFPTGKIAMREGPLMASSDRFTITVTGKQTHAAYPHEGIDAVTVAAGVIQELQTIRSRRINPTEPLVLSIGTINGGTRYNILPTEVTMAGTLRTFNPEVRTRAIELAKQITDGVCAAHGTTGSVEFARAGNPAVVNDKALTAEMRTAATKLLGADNVLESDLQMGAEDFSRYQQHVPGCFFFLGVRNGPEGKTAMLHTPDFDIDENAIPVGVRVMSTLALSYLETHSK